MVRPYFFFTACNASSFVPCLYFSIFTSTVEGSSLLRCIILLIWCLCFVTTNMRYIIMICYSFTLAFSCLLLNTRWTCWIFSVHVWYDRVWSCYLVQSHVLFGIRDMSFTICSAQMMYIVNYSCFVMDDLILVVFCSHYQVVWGNLARPLLIFSACCYRELCEVIKTYPFVNLISQLYWGKRDIVSTVLLWTDYFNKCIDSCWWLDLFVIAVFSLKFLMNLRRH